MAGKKNATTTDNEQFKRDMSKARGYVSAELRKNGIDIDVRLLTTISVMTSAALKFITKEMDSTQARKSFDEAISMYRNEGLPF